MTLRLSVLLIVALIGLAGCSDDDPANPPTTGTVVIDPTPPGIEAPWQLAGPDDETADGTGQRVLTAMAPGAYELTWGLVAGHVTPSSDPQTLHAGGTITFTGDYAIDIQPDPPAGFVHVPAGDFLMGSPADEPGRDAAFETLHQVTLTRGFYMAEHEVTAAWWYEVMGGTPSESPLPKHAVSWDEAVAFCNALSQQEGLTPAYAIHGPGGDVTWNQAADGYRLPTSAEWEHACRAGTRTAFASGAITHPDGCDDLDPNLDAIGWYCGNRTVAEGSAEVGLKPANAWGLHDMHGNHWEWVWCGNRTYTAEPQIDPVVSPAPGAARVLRGGSLLFSARRCRSAALNSFQPDQAQYSYGFRPVRTVF